MITWLLILQIYVIGCIAIAGSSLNSPVSGMRYVSQIFFWPLYIFTNIIRLFVFTITNVAKLLVNKK